MTNPDTMLGKNQWYLVTGEARQDLIIELNYNPERRMVRSELLKDYLTPYRLDMSQGNVIVPDYSYLSGDDLSIVTGRLREVYDGKLVMLEDGEKYIWNGEKQFIMSASKEQLKEKPELLLNGRFDVIIDAERNHDRN